ncbi:MAG: hypothetical protein ACYC7E_02535, partial [Armatimonadota bacterium]
MRILRLIVLLAVFIGASPLFAQGTPQPGEKPPAVLIIGQTQPDYAYLRELHQHGFSVGLASAIKGPLTWDTLKQFNCVVLTNLPVADSVAKGKWDLMYGPPYRAEFQELLKQYLAAGGGVCLLLDTVRLNTTDGYPNFNHYLNPWGATLTLERLFDPATETMHPRNLKPFIYTANIAPSPVSEKVRGIWFPIEAHSGNHNFEIYGQPIDYSKEWIPVVRGSDTSYSEAMKPGF